MGFGIMGEPGSGKSTSLRNLNPEETYYCDCDGKGLNWKGWRDQYSTDKSNYVKTSFPQTIVKYLLNIAEKAPHIHYFVVDTVNNLMVSDEMRRCKEKGYDKWMDLASSIWDLVDIPSKLRDDLTVILLFHTQTEMTDAGYEFTRIKTNGRKTEKNNIDSKFNWLLRSTKQEKVDLQKYVGNQHVALMWASPDCTSHSKAKGGQPRKQGLRILPWAVYKHAKAILPDVIIMENVEEIQQWGPLDEKGHPIKERAGEDYRKFISAMKNIGYEFDSRELVAADYGAPTTRKRWYAVFRRDGKQIVWPNPTHNRFGIDGLKRYEQCGDYIDWSDLGKSIFDRPKPLAEATQKRIANGIKKYIVDNPDPYIVKNKDALAFIIQYHGETRQGDSRGQLLTEPIKTIDTSNRLLCEILL